MTTKHPVLGLESSLAGSGLLRQFGVHEPPALLVDGADFRVLDSNPAMSAVLDRPSVDTVGRTLPEIFDSQSCGIPNAGEVPASSLLHLANGSGDVRSYGMSCVPVRWDARELVLCVLHDLTGWIGMEASLMRQNRELSRLARHDHLTGLFNRAMFHDTLKLANARLAREDGLLGVLYLDLDGFKPVNDRFGHDAGDRVLVEIAGRLRAGLRSSDVVGRLGGDEFGVIVEKLGSRKDALKVADQIIERVARPIDLDGESIRVSASIGAAVADRVAPDPADLLAMADRAMYEAKKAGRGRAALAHGCTAGDHGPEAGQS